MLQFMRLQKELDRTEQHCEHWGACIFLFKTFIYQAALGLSCCMWGFCCVMQHVLFVAHRLSNCGAQASLLHGMWDLSSLLLLLSCVSHVRLFVTPGTAAHQAPPSLGFFRQEHWSGLPFPSPMRESEK